MLDAELFYIFPLSFHFQSLLEKVSPAQKNLYIEEKNREESDLLRFLEIEGASYLTKAISVPISLNQLELMKKHIYSILKQLVPDYNYSEDCLTLMIRPHDTT